MSQALFIAYGRIAKKRIPDWFEKHHNRLQELKSEAFYDVAAMPDVFALFENAVGKCPRNLNNQRSLYTQVTHRRLFVAVGLVLYDQVWMHGYTGRLKSRLRLSMAEAINVNEAWISQTIDSIRFEYFNIDEFQMQVNLIAYCIRMQGKNLA